MLVKKVSDLFIYTKALRLNRMLFGLVQQIPFHHKNPEANQIIRSSNSVPSNISEGFANRFYQKKFIQYLNIALGSCDETQNHLRILVAETYIDQQTGSNLLREYKNLSVRILNLINYYREKNGV
jgi:four helix bundle protein